jgi:hypothetical protein
VFGYISVVVVEGVFVRDCRGMGLCAIGTVGQTVGGECAGGKGRVVTGWGRIEGGGEDRGKSGWEGAERVVGRGNNGLQHRKMRESKGNKNRDKKIVMVKFIM